MNKIRNWLSKIIVPVYLLTAAVNVLAVGNVGAPVITPVTEMTKEGFWNTLDTILNWFVALLGLASVVFLLYGAYMYMSAGQNEENLKKAKATVLYGVIGAVVAIVAFSVFKFAAGFISTTGTGI